MSEEQSDDKKDDAHKDLVHEVCDRTKFYERNDRCLRCAPQVDTPYGKGSPGCYLAAEETITIVMQSAAALTSEPVASLWQHDETGRTLARMAPEEYDHLLGPGWRKVGPLYFAPHSAIAPSKDGAQ
jgi:hypothetical protein